MDIFDNDGNFIQGHGGPPQYDNNDFIDVSKYLGNTVGEDTSFPEKFLDKSIGTFQRIFNFIIIIVGILTLLIFLTPFFRFVTELSSWTDNQVWRIFH